MGGNTSSGEDVLNRLVGPVRKPGPTRRGKGPAPAKAARRGRKSPARKRAGRPARGKKRG